MTIDLDKYEGIYLLGQYHIRVLYLVGYLPRSLRQSLAGSLLSP